MIDAQQKKAVEIYFDPLLVIAGAGSGKTTVVTEKIKYLIKNNLAKPEEILALTFTEKAAFEMEERVDRAMPYGYFQMYISTFHGFADQILKEEASQIGLDPAFKLMTEAESILFLKKNLFLFSLKYFRPLGNPNKFLSALLQHFSRLQDEDVLPTQYLAWVSSSVKASKNKQNQEDKVEGEKSLELAQAYKKYLDLKIKEGVMDFSDLVYYLNRLFHRRPNVLKKYQQQFKYVLIDEFQDTNIGQYQLIKLLCPPDKKPRLTVVGDDSQSIYKFRGASVSNILNFMKDYPQAKQVTLINNYRSNQTILDAAYRLIKHNDPDTLEVKLGINKKLISQKKNDKQAVKFYFADRVENEAEFVAKKINELKKDYKLSDFAILVRANSHSEPFIRVLTRYGIPYQFLGPSSLFKQPEVRDLMAYLKLLHNLEDSVSCYRVLSMDLFALDSKDLHTLLSFSKKINQPLFQAMQILLSFYFEEIVQEEFAIYKKYLPLTQKETRKKMFMIYQMVKSHLEKIKKYTAGQILYFFFEDTGYLKKLIDYKTEQEETKAINISKFFDKLKNYETTHEDASVFAVVDFLEMSMELGESPIVSKTDLSTLNAVNIVTVHSAKGLEFPIVFLVNLSRGRFPTYERREAIPIPNEMIKEILPEGNFHEQEERRLFYVALTRAIDKVFLSASQFYGEGRERKISPFLVETLGEKIIDQKIKLIKEEKEQLSIFDFKPPKDDLEIKNQKEKNNLNQFSFTQLSVFKTCPLQYKYQYVLKIPTTPGSAESFGSSIHKTLENFYKIFLSKNDVGLNELIDIFNKNWIPIGYASKTHETKMKKEGKNMLTEYFKKIHSPSLKIISLEKMFRIKIADNLFLTGKIDRVDLLPNNGIEIIDYKTGRKPEETEIKKNIQLTIYAMAASDKGLFNKPLSQIKLSFYYFQDMDKVTLQKSKEEVMAVRKEIIDLAKKIQNSDFSPKVGIWCSFCPFKMICEAWQ